MCVSAQLEDAGQTPSSSSPLKLTDVLKRKRGAKRGAVGSRKSRTGCAVGAAPPPPTTTASTAAVGVEGDASAVGAVDGGHDYLRQTPGAGGARSKFGFAVSSNGSGVATPPSAMSCAASGSGGATKVCTSQLDLVFFIKYKIDRFQIRYRS